MIVVIQVKLKMVNFKVLEHNQKFLSWIGIDLHDLNEPKNTFFYSITAYYFLFTIITLTIMGSALYVFEYWPQFDIISQPIMFVFGGSSSIGLILSVGINMKSVKVLHLKLQTIVDESNVI